MPCIFFRFARKMANVIFNLIVLNTSRQRERERQRDRERERETERERERERETVDNILFLKSLRKFAQNVLSLHENFSTQKSTTCSPHC